MPHISFKLSPIALSIKGRRCLQEVYEEKQLYIWLIIFQHHMAKNTCRYSKVTQQQKFHLLTLVLKDKMLIKQAAKLVNINYSTAKTIIFFHRNHSKSYQFDFNNTQSKALISTIEAIVSELPLIQPETSQTVQNRFMPIDIVSTIGSKKFCANEVGSEFQDSEREELPIKNYPLSHQDLHAQQKSEPEDILTPHECRRVTRSQTGSFSLACLAPRNSFATPTLQNLVQL